MPITEPEGVSVSQSSSSVVFDGSRKPEGERNVDQSVVFGVTRNTCSAHSKFSENTQAEKVVERTGKPEGENSSNAQIRTLLDEQRQMIKFLITNSKQLKQKKSGNKNWNFVKFINKILKRIKKFQIQELQNEENCMNDSDQFGVKFPR